MPATTPNEDDEAWVTVANMGNNVWVDHDSSGQSWRVRHKHNTVEKFGPGEYGEACVAAFDYIRSLNALKGVR